MKDQFAGSCLVGPRTWAYIGADDLIRADLYHIDRIRAIDELITRFGRRHVMVQLGTRNRLAGWLESGQRISL